MDLRVVRISLWFTATCSSCDQSRSVCECKGPDSFPETQNITAYNFNFIGYNIVLVDTPGFDDTYRSDRDILQSLVEWLTRIYKEGTKLSGILYLHRITDVRMQGSATRNLRVFRDLCGEACFSNVLLCTTFWDTAAETESSLEARLTELCQNEEFWGGMIANGSRVCKGPVTRAAAISMIYELIGCPKATLKVQKEIVDEYKPLNESSAVSALMNLELERQKQGHEARLATERKVFEDMLRLKDRKTSEDMESMRKVFDQKLADLDQTNKKLLEDLGEIEKVSRKPNMSAANEAPEYKRAITFAAGDQSAMDEMVRRRRQRYANFANYLKATTELLENEKRYGRVKIDFFSRKSCYTIVCTNCLKNIGSSECYSKYVPIIIEIRILMRNRVRRMQHRKSFHPLYSMLLQQ